MKTIKLLKRGTREIKIDPAEIIAGHVLDKMKRPTGRLLPERAYELTSKTGQWLMAKYPKDFLNLSAAIESTAAPELKKSSPQGAVPVVAPAASVAPEKGTSAPNAASDAGTDMAEKISEQAKRDREAAEAKEALDKINKAQDGVVLPIEGTGAPGAETGDQGEAKA